MRRSPTGVVLAVSGLLALATACKVSVGGRSPGATESSPAATAPPPASERRATPELTAARTELVALLGARIQQWCSSDEARRPEGQAACTTASADLPIAAPATEPSP